MRNRFHTQLELLNNELIIMGALCENSIASAVKALTEDDKALAKKAISLEKQIDEKEREIESLCLKLLLQQQPVAKDLRQISSALKMITDIERIGDQASDISEIVLILPKNPNDTKISHIKEMAQSTIFMVSNSIDAFVNKDLDLVEKVINYDDIVDNLFDKIKHEIVELIAIDENNSESAIDYLMIAKYLERIGDHAVNIAEWVKFSITGEHKGENAI